MCPQITNNEKDIPTFIPKDLHDEMVRRNIEPFSVEFYALNDEFNLRALAMRDNLAKLSDEEWSGRE